MKDFLKKIGLTLVAVSIFYAPTVNAARTDSFWNSFGNYIQTINPLGYDILINGIDKYLNFNAISGETGYGFRDNSGTVEFKNSGGAWTGVGTGSGGGGAGTVTTSSEITVNNFPYWFNTTGGLTGTSTIYQDSQNAEIGINTSNPSTTLDILGSFRSNGTLTFSDFQNCNLDTDANGLLVCGTDSGGGGSDENWTYFNTSGLRPTTSTNNVLIGGTATTSDVIFQVIGNSNFTATSTFESGLIVDTSTLFVDPVTNRVGIGTTTPQDSLHVISGILLEHTATETDDHALEIDAFADGFGDVKAVDIAYDTGTIETGDDEAVILVDINDIDALGGSVYGLAVLVTDGSSDSVYATKSGAGVGPVLQDSGTFANPTTGTNDTTATDVADMIDGSTTTNTTIFVADDDYILIGASAAFTEIEFIIETGAGNPGIVPVFGYSISGSHQFTTFSPVDGTNGFKNTGVVAWDATDLVSHTTNDDTGTFDIKITRTHNAKGNVSLFYAKTAETVVYKWDKNGDILVRNVTSTSATTTNLSVSGNLNASYLTSAIILAGADGDFSEYAGDSCTNQFVRSLSALGAATCESVSLSSDVTGTLDISDSTNLAVTFPIVLTDDTISLGFGTTTANTWSGVNTFTGDVVLGSATSTNFSVSANLNASYLSSALVLAGSDGDFAEYAGGSCTNQFVRSISAVGGLTCETVDLTADVTGALPIANAGTGTTTPATYGSVLAFTGSLYEGFTTSSLAINFSDMVGTVDISDQTNLAGGTNITLAGDTLNVDDAFLINDGDDTTSGKLTIAGGFVSQASSTVTGNFTIDGTTTTISGVAYNFPDADGSDTQVLTTNGAGQLTWAADDTGAGSDGNWSYVDPSLLRLVTSTISVLIGGSATTTDSNLEVIGDLAVTATTTFNSVSYKFPSADGTDGQVLTTNAAGQLTWTTAAGGGSAAWLSQGGDFEASTSTAASGDRFVYASRETNGATQIAHLFDTENAFSTAGAKLLSLQNATVEKFSVDLDGDIAATELETDRTIIGRNGPVSGHMTVMQTGQRNGEIEWAGGSTSASRVASIRFVAWAGDDSTGLTLRAGGATAAGGGTSLYLAGGADTTGYASNYSTQAFNLVTTKPLFFDGVIDGNYDGYQDTPGDTGFVKYASGATDLGLVYEGGATTTIWNASGIKFATTTIFVSSSTPASASAQCDEGERTWDADYIYQCTATDTWKRSAISTW